MDFGKKGLETLKTGGYVVFLNAQNGEGFFVGFWSNPGSDEYEINNGPLVREQPLRTDGDCRKCLYHSELLNEYFTLLNRRTPNLIYSYTPNALGTLPEGFKEVRYLIPYKGIFKALSGTGELLSLIPESSAIHLFVECGIPYTSGLVSLSKDTSNSI